MSTFARPAAVATALSLAAILLHPALATAAWLPARREILASALLGVVLAFVARAWAPAESRKPGERLLALGAVLALLGLALDGLYGHEGTVTLAPGRALGSFHERDASGRELGLRPFGFHVALERDAAQGLVLVASSGGRAPVRPGRSARLDGFRFAVDDSAATGGASRLRVSASDGQRSETVEIGPGRNGRVFGAEVALDQYFPDFALDANRQPYTRSQEARNPAALLRVERGGQSHRAFVIRALPGVHRIEALGLAFTLLEVEPEQALTLRVSRQPFALLALLGLLLMAAGAAVGPVARALRRASEPPAAAGRLAHASALTCVALLIADRGRVLGWRFGLDAAGVARDLPGVGVLLGVALLASLGAALLLLGQGLARAGDVRAGARASAFVALGFGAAGVLLALVRLLPGGRPGTAWAPLLGLALALAWLAVSLLPAGRARARLAALATGGAALAGLAALPLAGVWSTLAHATYVTDVSAAAGAAALAGLAALEPAALTGPRAFAFAVALASLLLRQT